MVKETQYTSIRRVLDDLLEDAHMENLTLEQVIKHTVRFINKHGYPQFYQDKQTEVDIHQFRGVLPCDLVSIVQVKDHKTGLCMRSMTDNFYPEEETFRPSIPSEASWKTQGTIIYTSFPEGEITVAYKATPVDDDGFPMLIDNESYIDALEAYISMKTIRNKFRQGKIPAAVYQDAQQEYAVAARELMTEMTTPSQSEMESITRRWNTLIPKVKEFDKGFHDLGNREFIRRH
jgi:hypothetical protein